MSGAPLYTNASTFILTIIIIKWFVVEFAHILLYDCIGDNAHIVAEAEALGRHINAKRKHASAYVHCTQCIVARQICI